MVHVTENGQSERAERLKSRFLAAGRREDMAELERIAAELRGTTDIDVTFKVRSATPFGQHANKVFNDNKISRHLEFV